MKRFRSVFLTLMTIILVISGFSLPTIVFSYQNRQIESRIDQFSMEQTQFYCSSSLIDTINLLKNGYYNLDFSREKAVSTAGEAYENVLDCMDELLACGFELCDKDNITSHYDSIFLAVANSGSVTESNSQYDSDTIIEGKTSSSSGRDETDYVTTAVIWEIVIDMEQSGTYMTFFFDDQNKKIVSFNIYFEEYYAKYEDEINFSIEGIINFITNYYGFDFVEIRESGKNYNYTDYNTISLAFSDSAGNEIEIPFGIYMDAVIFNDVSY